MYLLDEGEGDKMKNKKMDPFLKPRYFTRKRNIFKWLFLIVKGWFTKGDILRAEGVHIINGYQGSGKTLLANGIIQETDKSKYFFLSNISEFEGVKYFNINELFDNNEQVKKLPLKDEYDRTLYAVILDEINLQYNKRLNRTKDYNNTFIGLVELIVSMRHQGVKRIYFIGQKLELQDTQLISLFKYQHDIIKTIRRPFYWYYYENGYIQYLPKKLKIIHRLKSQDTSDEFIDWKIQKHKIPKEWFKTYDTHALAKYYINLQNIETRT